MNVESTPGAAERRAVTWVWAGSLDGLVDVGPAIGLWYLAGTILMLRSMRWVKDAARKR
jgi:hypothetical protein